MYAAASLAVAVEDETEEESREGERFRVGEVDELAGRDADDVVPLSRDALLERRAEELGERVVLHRKLDAHHDNGTEEREDDGDDVNDGENAGHVTTVRRVHATVVRSAVEGRRVAAPVHELRTRRRRLRRRDHAVAHQVSPMAALLAVRDVAHEQHARGAQTTLGREHEEAARRRGLGDDVHARARAVERVQRQHVGVERQTEQLPADVLRRPHPLAGCHAAAHIRPLLQQRVVVHRYLHVHDPRVRLVDQVPEGGLRMRELPRHQAAVLRAHERASPLARVVGAMTVATSPVSVAADGGQGDGSNQ